MFALQTQTNLTVGVSAILFVFRPRFQHAHVQFCDTVNSSLGSCPEEDPGRGDGVGSEAIGFTTLVRCTLLPPGEGFAFHPCFGEAPELRPGFRTRSRRAAFARPPLRSCFHLYNFCKILPTNSAIEPFLYSPPQFGQG